MRPQKLQLVGNETYTTQRLTSDTLAEENITTINNMTHMTQFVYDLYMKKLESIKDQLPTAAETDIYSDMPQEDEPMEVAEEPETEYQIIENQPPAKRPVKENTTKKSEPKVFKPTPIVNEIAVDEEQTEKSPNTAEQMEESEETKE